MSCVRCMPRAGGQASETEEVASKARDLMTPVLGDANARRVVERVWELERLTSVSTLCALLQKPGK